MKDKVLGLIRNAQMLFDPETTDELTQQLYDPEVLARVVDKLFSSEEIYSALRQRIIDEVSLAYHMARQSGSPEDLKIFRDLHWYVLKESKYPGTSGGGSAVDITTVEQLDEAYADMERVLTSENINKYELYDAANKMFDIPEFFREEVDKKLMGADHATIDALHNVLSAY